MLESLSSHRAQWLWRRGSLPCDLLKSPGKCFSELSTCGNKGEAFVHLHLSPIVKFATLCVCASVNTAVLPTGSTLGSQRGPGTGSKRKSRVSPQGKALARSCPELVSACSAGHLEQETGSRGFGVEYNRGPCPGLMTPSNFILYFLFLLDSEVHERESTILE